MNTEKMKEFGKKHWKKAAVAGGALALVGVGVALKQKSPVVAAGWTQLENLSQKVANAHKYTSNDEWNGCVTACLEDVTMDELCDEGKKLLVDNGLKEDTIVRGVRFITEGVKETQV